MSIGCFCGQRVLRCRPIPILVCRSTAPERYTEISHLPWRRYCHATTPLRIESQQLGETVQSDQPPKARSEDGLNQDIVPGDLKATLEAHQRSNRALFRKVYIPQRQKRQKSPIGRGDQDPASKTIMESMEASEYDAAVESEQRALEEERYSAPRWAATDMADFSDRLDTEMKNIESVLSLTPEEVVFRGTLAQHIMAIVQKEFPDIQYNRTGSTHTGIAHTFSDIDIGFTLPNVQLFPPGRYTPLSDEQLKEQKRYINESQSQIRPHLLRMREILAETRMFRTVQVRWGRCPLVYMEHRSGAVIELVHVVRTDSAIAYVNEWIGEYPQIRSVYMILKATMAVRQLDQAITGVNSYVLFMMIVASFKLQPISRSESLGKALLSVLQFWASFDTNASCILFEPVSIVGKNHGAVRMSEETANDPVLRAKFRLTTSNVKRPKLLVLQDPADLESDLGMSCPKIKQVQAVIKSFESKLSDAFDTNPNPTSSGLPLHTFVRGYPNSAFLRRSRFDRWINRSEKSPYQQELISKFKASLPADEAVRAAN